MVANAPFNSNSNSARLSPAPITLQGNLNPCALITVPKLSKSVTHL